MSNSMPSEPLSERQIEILAYLAEGLTNREIASRLYLSLAGVKWNNSEIYGKLGVRNRDEAIERAIELGLLGGESDSPQPTGKHNLPESVTEFVGRKQEISDLQQLVDSKRLVTILAPGGMGKTRLSQAVARTQIGHHRDGVYFVPLAPLSSANDIVTTIAENIGFVFHGENPPTQQLVNFLKDRSMLIVLDNFEHLLDGAGLVSDIIQSTPNIKVIATSRERLNLRGETVYSLSGLEFPKWETPEDAIEYDAVKLFMQSANRARSDFELQTDELGFLARICRLTAGMPLGIELAAGWVDVLSLQQIADEIQQGIDILETDMRDVPERHRSLRATFESTWNRLTDTEQIVFGRLSVFRGGFSLESAEAVVEANARHLKKLTQKTLIQTDTNKRFAVHELLRQFGEGKLAETDELPMIQQKHATYFANFMAERKQDIKNNRQLEALDLIDADYENVRISWLYLVDQQQWEQLPKFLHSLGFYCNIRSRGQEVLNLTEYAINTIQAIPLTSVTEQILGRMMALLGWAYRNAGLSEKGTKVCTEALRIVQQYGNTEGLLETFYHSFLNTNSDQKYKNKNIILSTVQDWYRISRSMGDEYWEFVSQGRFANQLIQSGDYTDGLALAEQVLNRFPNRRGSWDILYLFIGLTYESLEQYEKAKGFYEQQLMKSERFVNASAIGISLIMLGNVLRKQYNYDEAYTHFKESLQIFNDAGFLWIIPWSLQHISQLLSDQEHMVRAIEILATIHLYPIPFNLDHLDSNTQELREELEAKLDPERFAIAWERGKSRSINDLVMEILSELRED
jgi:predicted ATPase/DNA-binding CsgD family transcriptional regulator